MASPSLSESVKADRQTKLKISDFESLTEQNLIGSERIRAVKSGPSRQTFNNAEKN
jgi:hypothetical protein